jgi:hypothetical protein
MNHQDKLTHLCTEANAAFQDESVLTADRRKLERWLIALCDIRPPDDGVQKWNLRRAEAIKYLLQVHITERLAQQTRIISILALIVSLTAATFAGLKYFHDTSPPAAVHPSVSAPPPAPKGVSP